MARRSVDTDSTRFDKAPKLRKGPQPSAHLYRVPVKENERAVRSSIICPNPVEKADHIADSESMLDVVGPGQAFTSRAVVVPS